jgi:hypothetical protein
MKYTQTCPLLLALISTPAFAGPIFTWVDRDGVTHFSESPPENASVKARQIEVEPVPVVGNTGEDDYYSVVQQLDRMQKRRLENERAKAEQLQAETAARQADTAAAKAQEQESQDEPAPTILYPVPVPVHPPQRHRHDGLRDYVRDQSGRLERRDPPPYTRNPKYKPPEPERESPRRPRHRPGKYKGSDYCCSGGVPSPSGTLFSTPLRGRRTG